MSSPKRMPNVYLFTTPRATPRPRSRCRARWPRPGGAAGARACARSRRRLPAQHGRLGLLVLVVIEHSSLAQAGEGAELLHEVVVGFGCGVGGRRGRGWGRG